VKAEDCPRIDECLSVKSLYSRDWASDAQLAAAIRLYCETCPGPPGVISSNEDNMATTGRTENQ